MKTNVVLKSEFGAAPFERFDAEFVDPVLLAEEKALHKAGAIALSVLAKPFLLRPIMDRGDSDPVSYIAIDAVDNQDGLALPETLRYEHLPSRAKHEVRPGDILVSNVRPNRGAVTLISERHNGAAASSGFTLVSAVDRADSECLFAFLKTPWATNQLIRRNRGSMYPAVLSSDVFDIFVLLPTGDTRDAVTRLIADGFREHDEFHGTYARQQDELARFLLPYGTPPDPLEPVPGQIEVTVIRSSQVFGPVGAERFDAEFFRHGYEDFDRHCQRTGQSFVLGEWFKLTSGAALRPSSTALTPYIKQSALTNVGINWSAVFEEEGLPLAGFDVRAGDVLLACTAHEVFYVGRRADYVRDVPAGVEKNSFVADLIRMRPREGTPGTAHAAYVAAFLHHPAGLFQVQRCIRGLRGGHVYSGDLERHVRVPIPPPEWTESFKALSAQAEAQRNHAKKQISMAIKMATDFCTSSVGCEPADFSKTVTV